MKYYFIRLVVTFITHLIKLKFRQRHRPKFGIQLSGGKHQMKEVDKIKVKLYTYIKMIGEMHEMDDHGGVKHPPLCLIDYMYTNFKS